MPAPGSKLIFGNRKVTISNDFVKLYKKKFPNTPFTGEQIKQLCKDGNQIIQDSIKEDPTGFRLPFFLGHVCITRYKSKNGSVDSWSSKKYKKAVPFVNSHTFGYRFSIRHFRLSDSKRIAPMLIYKFIPSREFKVSFSKSLRETGGEQYLNFRTNDFISKKKINKLRNLNYSEWD